SVPAPRRRSPPPRRILRGDHGRRDDRRTFVCRVPARCDHDRGSCGNRDGDRDDIDRIGRSGGCATDRCKRQMTDEPLDLDKHRGMAAQKATDLRRALAEVENNARSLRDRQSVFEGQLLTVPAASWPEAAAKARYVLNLYAAGLSPEDSHHRDLVAKVLEDFARLARES